MEYVPGIVALGFLIVVHEAGHYFVARWCRMRVERFSVGFGPGILKRRAKNGTVFQLAPIPFGGFVEIRGMNIAEEVDPEDAAAYPNRPAWQRFITILAGPATNYISAIFLAFGLYVCHGQPGGTYSVGEVNPNSDAVGKIVDGDRIIEIDGEPLVSPSPLALSLRVNLKPQALAMLINEKQSIDEVAKALRVPKETITTWRELASRNHDKFRTWRGDPIELKVQRGDHVIAFTIEPRPARTEHGTPAADPETKRIPFQLGLLMAPDMVDVGIGEATRDAFAYPFAATKIIFAGFRDIFTGDAEADPTGPVGIVGEFGKAFKRGLPDGIKLLMALSVYLGLFNLLPLPALDGGRLVFLGYEMITRRRANPKIETMVHMSGIMILMVIMVLVTLKDCGLFRG